MHVLNFHNAQSGHNSAHCGVLLDVSNFCAPEYVVYNMAKTRVYVRYIYTEVHVFLKRVTFWTGRHTKDIILEDILFIFFPSFSLKFCTGIK
jgi:hypothetical protein